jgi:hypothetical protein
MHGMRAASFRVETSAKVFFCHPKFGQASADSEFVLKLRGLQLATEQLIYKDFLNFGCF